MNIRSGEDVLDLVDLVRRDDDRAGLVEVVVQQRVVELLPIEDVEAERRLIEHQQSRVDRHDEREVQLRDHAFDSWRTLLVRLIVVFARKAFRFRAIEPRMHTSHVVERLRDLHPAGQHGDIRDEADITHEEIALRPRIAAEHLELALEREEAQDRVERSCFAGAVRPDEAEDAAFFDVQVDAVECDGAAVRLAETASFDRCHNLALLLAFGRLG
jgi:hypothetical protein